MPGQRQAARFFSFLGLILFLLAPELGAGAAGPSKGQAQGLLLEPISPENVQKLTQIGLLPYPEGLPLTALAFDGPDGERLAAGFGEGTIQLWEWESLQELAAVREHAGVVSDLAFSPEDFDVLASASFDTSVRLWFVLDSGLEPNRVFDVDDVHPVEALSFSPSGLTLAVGYGDNRILLWRVADGNQLMTRTGDESAFRINDVAFSSQGDLLAAASADASISLWGVVEGGKFSLSLMWARTVASLLESTVVSVPTSLAFSPASNEMLAVGTFDGLIVILDAPARSLVHHTAVTGRIEQIGFSPDGRLLYVCTRDGKTQLWETETWTEVRQIVERPLAAACAISTDGRALAIGAEAGIQLWAVAPEVPTPAPTPTAAPSSTPSPTAEPSLTATETGAPTATMTATVAAEPTATPTPQPPLLEQIWEEAVAAFGGALGAGVFALAVAVLTALVVTIAAVTAGRRAGEGWGQAFARALRLFELLLKREFTKAYELLRMKGEPDERAQGPPSDAGRT